MPKKLDIPIPDYFRCPISLELMREPVTLSTGQTYDRASIEKWVMDGNATCPATMQRLHDFTLIPNHTLRRLIQEWCFANQSQLTQPSALKKMLQEVQNGSKDAKIEALRSLRSLAKDSDKNRSMILQQGAIPVMADALFQDLESIKDMEVAEEALGVLSMLRLTEKEAESIAKSDRLVVLGSILKKGQTECRINGALLIERMIVASDLLKEKIGEASGMIEGILKLVKEGGKSRVSKIGIRVLFSLCLSNSGNNIDRSVKAGAASILVEHLPDSTKGDADRTLATLELICKTEAGKSAVSSHALSVPVLIKMILQVSDQATECAAGTLCSICSCSKSVQQYAVQTGIFTQLLLLIQSDCTDRAKRKAMELLRMLGNSWSQDPCLAEFGRTSIVAF